MQFWRRHCLRQIGWPQTKHPSLESNTESLAIIQPKLYRFERLGALLSPPHAPKEQPILAVGGVTPPVHGVDVVSHRLPLGYCCIFPDFPRIMEWCGSKYRLWVRKLANIGVFAAQILGSTYEHPTGHNQSGTYSAVWQSIAKIVSGTSKICFRENDTKKWASAQHWQSQFGPWQYLRRIG